MFKFIAVFLSAFFATPATALAQSRSEVEEAALKEFEEICIPPGGLTKETKPLITIDQKANTLSIHYTDTRSGGWLSTACWFDIASGQVGKKIPAGIYCARKDGYERVSIFSLFGGTTRANYSIPIGKLKGTGCIEFNYYNGELNGEPAIHGFPHPHGSPPGFTYLEVGNLSNGCIRMSEKNAFLVSALVFSYPGTIQINIK